MNESKKKYRKNRWNISVSFKGNNLVSTDWKEKNVMLNL